jgi:hypothetical protein
MRNRSKLARVAIWALILAGGFFAYRKTRAAKLATPGSVSGLSGAYPTREAGMYPPGSGSTY